MKQLSLAQLEFIRKDLINRGLSSEALINELTDHVACSIEDRGFSEANFHEVYAAVMAEFAPMNFQMIQAAAGKILFTKKMIYMKLSKIMGIALLTYASFVMALSFTLLKDQANTVSALRLAAFLSYGTTTLIAAFHIIRLRTRSLVIQIVCAIAAHILFLIFLVSGLKETGLPTGKSVLAVMPTVSAMLIATIILLYVSQRNSLKGKLSA
jgi:hypothetical protein